MPESRNYLTQGWRKFVLLDARFLPKVVYQSEGLPEHIDLPAVNLHANGLAVTCYCAGVEHSGYEMFALKLTHRYFYV